MDGMPNKETWDKVSLDYTIDINEDERQYAEEISKLFKKEGILPQSKILELGSGSGHLSACLAQMGYKVSLLDFSVGALNKSKETFKKYELDGEFIEGDLFDLSNVSKDYDIVWNSGVMEHFDEDNLLEIFKQIRNIMNSKFIFLVPNPDSISYLLMRYNLEGQDKWEYGQEYMRRNYLQIAQKAGLSGKVLGYAASSISIWHFESTFQQDINRKMYGALVNDGIMPSNESYLIAYIVCNNENEQRIYNKENNEELKIEIEQFFAKSAENFALRKEAKKLNDDLVDVSNKLLNSTENNRELQKENKELEENSRELQKENKELEENSREIEKENKKLEENNRELQKEKEDNNAQLVKITSEILPQIHSSTNRINDIFRAKWFSKVVAIHAIVGALAKESFVNKIKICVKLALRLVGKNYDLLIDEYRMNYKVTESIRNIENLIQIAKVNCDKISHDERSPEKLPVNNQIYIEESIYAEEPLVSILLPVYNHAAFIKAAINAVQRQTYSNWELIILNDGSTDGLLDVLKEYSCDSRIKIYTQDNQRLPNGLTNLHNLALGQYITWTSADNVMKEEMVQKLVDKLMQSPEAVMVYADVAIIDENGNFKTTGYREMNRDPKLPYIMRLPHCTETLDIEADNFINACFMYRSEPVKALKGQYSADLEGLEDYDFWLRLRTFGKIVHLNNEEPLYYYRVHENTMSEDLLKNKLEEHANRTKKMINYSQEKDAFAKENWNMQIDMNVEGADNFEQNIKETNYAYLTPSRKVVNYTNKESVEKLKNKEVAITCANKYYQIWVNEDNKIENRAKIYQGFNVNLIAKKVRQTFITGLFWEYPAKFVGMKVLGTHIELDKIDVAKTIKFIKNNKEILFSFCLLGSLNQEIQKEIEDSCENVIFMGKREFGTQLYVYASWDAMFIPPLKKIEDLMPQILLGWSIGRWIMVSEQDFRESMPFISKYYYGEKILGIKKIENQAIAENILDKYIEYYSTVGAVRNVINFLNGITQDILVQRPDFMLKHKERKFPPTLVKNEMVVPQNLKNGYIGILVDTLDKGGLEQVVAHLTKKMVEYNIDVRVLCTISGGQMAQKLKEDGYEVVIFDGNTRKFDEYVKQEKPLLINTHYAHNMLDIVKKNNIPMVEVIHNMYVFQDERFMKEEKQRSIMCKEMIAVSSIVKDVYEKRVLHESSDKIVVIGNAADPEKICGKNRNYTRKVLGIPKESVVFINVSSVDSRKNQMGLIKAFEQFNMTVNADSYLILVGNVLSDFYDKVLNDFIETTSCKTHIIKLSHHRCIGDLYKAADIFIMPSFFEGWSIAATEALYSGLPLIHSLCGSGKELVNGGENGILIPNPAGDIALLSTENLMEKMNTINPENTEDMLQAMIEMMNNIDMWRDKRGIISQSSILEFNQYKMIESYIELFAEVISKEK